MKQLFAVLFAVVVLLLPGLAGALPASGPAASKQYIVVIDLSASRNGAMLDEEQQFLGQLAGKLGFGDRMVLLQMQQSGLADHPLRWSVTMPLPKDTSFVTSRDRGQLSAAQTGIKLALPSFFHVQGDARAMHTDIFTTLHLAAESAQDGGSRRTMLILLSDMLQSGQGFEMERLRRMPPPQWVDAQARYGLLPHLKHACVLAIGADATTASGAKVRSFWQGYFTAADARLTAEDYRATPPSAEGEFCK